MDRQTAKEILKAKEPDFLQPARQRINGHISYICPSCGNGSGDSGTGIALNPKSKGKRYKCFVCGLNADIIELWKLHNGITDDKEAFEGLYRYYSLEVDSGSAAQGDFKKVAQNQPKSEQHTAMSTYTQPATDKKESFVPYFKQCQSHLTESDYLTAKRGISVETAAPFMLGFENHYTIATHGEVWQALIIPTSPYSYIARNTTPGAERYRNVGSIVPFNIKALQTAKKPIFITEGALDALSIIEVGGEAIGLGSTSNVDIFIKDYVKKQKPVQPLVIALDNDAEGQKAADKLEERLKELGVSYYRLNPYGGLKDANAALVADREAFTQAIAQADHLEEEALEAQREEYLKTSAQSHLQEFINGIAASADTPAQPTGFDVLDYVLDGGLYEGLYIIGAITSLGKTTLALQIADQVAASGRDVLIFSLEMARTELMSKSISRLTLLDTLADPNGDIHNAKTNRGITAGAKYKEYSQAERELIQRAITAYGEFAQHIFIHEGMGDMGTDYVRETVKKHQLITGQAPVVLIDYIQILAPYDVRATDKQNTDKAVLELKRISRDFKIPVIGISSFNRASYREEVTLEAFKESGSLEYGSDVLIGLQLKGAGSKDFNSTEAKKKDPREIELVILKNRNGKTGNKITLNYYSLFNYFKEV